MKRIVAVMLVCLSLAGPVSAEQPPTWMSRVSFGKRLYLTTHAGEVVSGLAEQLTRDAIVLATPLGIRAVRYGELRRVEKRDAQWTGAVVGAAFGAMIGIAANIVDRDCDIPRCAGESRRNILGASTYGALAGWALDAVVDGRTTIFESHTTTRVTVTARRGGLSATATLTW